MKKTVMTLAALMLVSAAAFADTTYDNTGSVSGQLQTFGWPNTATYGETFQAPSNSTLQSFSLFLNAPDVGPISGDLQGYVGTWTGNSVGTILYSSPLTAVTGQNQEFAFSPDISVTGGDEYVAFLSISGPEYSSFVGGTGMPTAGPTPGGELVFLNNGGDTSQFTDPYWTNDGSVNAEFKADFGPLAATPEPGSLVLLGTGVLSLAGVIRRKIQA